MTGILLLLATSVWAQDSSRNPPTSAENSSRVVEAGTKAVRKVTQQANADRVDVRGMCAVNERGTRMPCVGSVLEVVDDRDRLLEVVRLTPAGEFRVHVPVKKVRFLRLRSPSYKMRSEKIEIKRGEQPLIVLEHR